ncbi:MAG: WxcM-like domain-containing protein [Pseudobdellovibrio sp.]|jgi:dTDP-4-dehydrorhamnose 3,5-epimerase-like enzyme
MSFPYTEPTLIKGGLAVDDRGSLRFINDFKFEGVKRFYLIENHKVDFVRAWHGHKKEGKYFMVTSGSFLCGAVKIDNWENPSADLKVNRMVLSAQSPAILAIPPGYANGLMSLEPGSKLMVFSSTTLDESLNDDIRFPARFWNIWSVEER